MNLHLFFDVYIEDAPLGVFLRGNKDRFLLEDAIRKIDSVYRYQSKLDITRYTLFSYSNINWKSVTIRLECQNPKHEFIYDEVRELFPNASIHRERSDTAQKYLHALSSANINDDDWVFFSPNNDHPFLAEPNDLKKVIDEADDILSNDADALTSIIYSHYTEVNNSYKPTLYGWGVYADVFAKLIYDGPNIRAVTQSKMLLDSIHIFKMRDLKWIYGKTQVTGRLIRNEETEFYLSKLRKHITVLPKKELCRHYDSYMHILNHVPPLFIPPGFFEKNIHIRFGYKDSLPGWVNVNPSVTKYIYEDSGGVDLKCLLSGWPCFWRDYIKKVDINPDFDSSSIAGFLEYKGGLENPWKSHAALFNLLISGCRVLRDLHRRYRLSMRNLKRRLRES
jgi:hypothetical protein